MDSDIQIIEKPENVSWNAIHDVLWRAHEMNRKKGILMSYPSLSGDEIRNKIGSNGKLFVALKSDEVIGTLALIVKTGKQWYNSGQYGYLCFGAVLPEFSGKGVYRSLYELAENTARQLGLIVLTRDTNEKNARMLKITKQEGYHFVECKAYKDHFNIVRAKWLNSCPYPLWYINMRYFFSRICIKVRYKLDPQTGIRRRF